MFFIPVDIIKILTPLQHTLVIIPIWGIIISLALCFLSYIFLELFPQNKFLSKSLSAMGITFFIFGLFFVISVIYFTMKLEYGRLESVFLTFLVFILFYGALGIIWSLFKHTLKKEKRYVFLLILHVFVVLIAMILLYYLLNHWR